MRFHRRQSVSTQVSASKFSIFAMRRWFRSTSCRWGKHITYQIQITCVCPLSSLYYFFLLFHSLFLFFNFFVLPSLHNASVYSYNHLKSPYLFLNQNLYIYEIINSFLSSVHICNSSFYNITHRKTMLKSSLSTISLELIYNLPLKKIIFKDVFIVIDIS